MEIIKTVEEQANVETQLSSRTVLTFDGFLALSGLKRSYAYKLTSTGKVPCYKPLGKMIFFDKDEITYWLLQNRKATNDEIKSQANSYVTLNQKGGAK
jgi:predicted DNA-binding transcriptional regulator AlpA